MTDAGDKAFAAAGLTSEFEVAEEEVTAEGNIRPVAEGDAFGASGLIDRKGLGQIADLRMLVGDPQGQIGILGPAPAGLEHPHGLEDIPANDQRRRHNRGAGGIGQQVVVEAVLAGQEIEGLPGGVGQASADRLQSCGRSSWYRTRPGRDCGRTPPSGGRACRAATGRRRQGRRSIDRRLRRCRGCGPQRRRSAAGEDNERGARSAG